MNTERWEEVQAAFDELVDLDATQRVARLERLAISDPELHRALESLLKADAEAGAFLAPIDAALLPWSARKSDPLGLAGRTVSHFRLHEALGAGGMGVVYRADDTRLGRAVALKFLLPHYNLDPSARARFLREAHAVAALDHPKLCTVHEVGTSDDGWLFMALALYHGETLQARLSREGPVSVRETLEIARQIAEGLQAAHAAGIVHRDLKPGNVMLLPDGTLRILDFGLAKARDQTLSATSVRFGTVSYMSPEQIRAGNLDGRADLWALGVVLYEMLTGRKPFRGDEKVAIAHAILHDQPEPPSIHRRDLSEALEALVLRLLQKDPTRRHATADELLRDLVRIPAVADGNTGLLRRGRRSVRRRLTGTIQQVARERLMLGITGLAVLAAAIAAGSILGRNPAPTPPPDKVQLTFTGNATIPSLSPDGTRLAFAEKQCDEAGYCTYQVVIQNTDGSRRLVLARNASQIWKTVWTEDGRFLVFNGSYGPSRQGTFAISTLGGEPRHLGCCWFDLLSGDTVFLSVGMSQLRRDSLAWVRRITVHDGQTLDSIPVRDPGAENDETPLSYPDRLLVAARKTYESTPELRLIDFHGMVIDRVTPAFGSLGRSLRYRWVPSRQKLLVASQRELGGIEFDMLSMDVTASGIEPGVDTILSAIELRDGIFEISPDAERLVYSAGLVESSLSTIDVDRTPATRLAATQVLSSTTLLRGRISPAGDKIFLARDIPRPDGHASQFSLIPRNGGTESQIPGAVENLLDLQWSPDGARIMYLHGIAGKKVRLMETDTTGRRTREIVRLEQSGATAFDALPDGAICIVPAERRSISIIRRPGKRDVTWRVPDWLSVIGHVSHSPDAKSMAVQGWDRLRDSVVVATVDIDSGRFTRIGVHGGQDLNGITWLEDGSIMFVFREPEGAYVLYRIAPGRPSERLGALPHTRAEFSVSNDGHHVAAFGYSDKNDVYMIRNFGKMLRR